MSLDDILILLLALVDRRPALRGAGAGPGGPSATAARAALAPSPDRPPELQRGGAGARASGARCSAGRLSPFATPPPPPVPEAPLPNRSLTAPNEPREPAGAGSRPRSTKGECRVRWSRRAPRRLPEPVADPPRAFALYRQPGHSTPCLDGRAGGGIDRGGGAGHPRSGRNHGDGPGRRCSHGRCSHGCRGAGGVCAAGIHASSVPACSVPGGHARGWCGAGSSHAVPGAGRRVRASLEVGASRGIARAGGASPQGAGPRAGAHAGVI